MEKLQCKSEEGFQLSCSSCAVSEVSSEPDEFLDCLESTISALEELVQNDAELEAFKSAIDEDSTRVSVSPTRPTVMEDEKEKQETLEQSVDLNSNNVKMQSLVPLPLDTKPSSSCTDDTSSGTCESGNLSSSENSGGGVVQTSTCLKQSDISDIKKIVMDMLSYSKQISILDSDNLTPGGALCDGKSMHESISEVLVQGVFGQNTTTDDKPLHLLTQQFTPDSNLTSLCSPFCSPQTSDSNSASNSSTSPQTLVSSSIDTGKEQTECRGIVRVGEELKDAAKSENVLHIEIGRAPVEAVLQSIDTGTPVEDSGLVLNIFTDEEDLEVIDVTQDVVKSIPTGQCNRLVNVDSLDTPISQFGCNHAAGSSDTPISLELFNANSIGEVPPPNKKEVEIIYLEDVPSPASICTPSTDTELALLSDGDSSESTSLSLKASGRENDPVSFGGNATCSGTSTPLASLSVVDIPDSKPEPVCKTLGLEDSKSSNCDVGNALQDHSESRFPSTTSEQTSEPKKEYSSTPWVSTDADENADNFDPDWEIWRRLNSDEERYRAVRERWRSLTIPDPRRNLTYDSYRRRRLGISNTNAEVAPGNSRKRGRTYEDSLTGPPAKRKHLLPCATIFEDKINKVYQEIDEEFMKLEQKQKDALYELCLHQQGRQDSILRMRASPQYKRREIKNLYHEQVREVEVLKNRFEDKLRNMEAEKIKTIKVLRSAGEEYYTFNKFYHDLRNSDSGGQLFITEDEVQELKLSEYMYDLYDHIYAG